MPNQLGMISSLITFIPWNSNSNRLLFFLFKIPLYFISICQYYIMLRFILESWCMYLTYLHQVQFHYPALSFLCIQCILSSSPRNLPLGFLPNRFLNKLLTLSLKYHRDTKDDTVLEWPGQWLCSWSGGSPWRQQWEALDKTQ